MATARLEEWSSVGTAVRCHYDLIAPKGERGPALAADNSSLPDLSRFSELVTWIQDWDLDLWNRPEEPFAPSARALDVLGRRLGIAPDTINTWVTSSCIPVDHLMSERELSKDARNIFVVHGRDEAVKRGIFDFLRSVGLKPLEWEAARGLTKKPNPYVGEILDVAFEHAQAIVVVLSGDVGLIRSRRQFDYAARAIRPFFSYSAGLT